MDLFGTKTQTVTQTVTPAPAGPVQSNYGYYNPQNTSGYNLDHVYNAVSTLSAAASDANDATDKFKEAFEKAKTFIKAHDNLRAAIDQFETAVSTSTTESQSNSANPQMATSTQTTTTTKVFGTNTTFSTKTTRS